MHNTVAKTAAHVVQYHVYIFPGGDSLAKTNSERVNDCVNRNYDRLHINIPKGGNQLLKREAKTRGLSVTGLVVEAIRAYCGIDLRKD